MNEPPSKAPRRRERPQTKTAGDTLRQASTSRPAGETVEPISEASFKAIPEAATSQRTQDAATTSRRNAIPEAVVRPRQQAPARSEKQAGAAPSAWLPAGLRTLLSRLALPVALLAIPVAAALASQAWLARTHLVYDGSLSLADGDADEVTALQWSPTDGALYVGTRLGNVRRIGEDGTSTPVLEPGGTEEDPNLWNPVLGIELPAGLPVIARYQNRTEIPNSQRTDAFLLHSVSKRFFFVDGPLVATVGANNGTAVVGRATTSSGQVPNNNLLNAANQPAPQKQQQQIKPTWNILDTPDPFIRETPRGPPRYQLSLYRDLQGSAETEVGEIYGVEDVRVMAALPGTDTVIAGDGNGNVFAIDASQQISGASPETYIRGIGQHEAAIVEIAVAAQPAANGVMFASRAEDRSIKVWRGSVSRASQLIPLGDYPNIDVTMPGSIWAREQVIAQQSGAAGSAVATLLSMSSDGNRIAGAGTDSRLRIITRNAAGQMSSLQNSGDRYGQPMMLTPDGDRLVVFNRESQALELVALSADPGGSAPLTMSPIATFTAIPGPIMYLAFDRAGRRFVAMSGNGTVYIQDVTTPDRVIALGQYQETGIEAAISPDGSLVAVAETSGQIMIHSAEDGSELTILDSPPAVEQLGFQDDSKMAVPDVPQNIGQLAFDSSGKRLRASTTGTLRVYTHSLRNPRSTTYDSGLLSDAGREGFFPSGDRFFKRIGEAGYRIIDLDSGADVGALQAAANATGWVSNLDGSRIATLGGRGNISLFREEESPTENGPMPSMADNAMRLSADGHTLVVGGRTGELYLARLDGDASQAGYRLRHLNQPTPALQYEVSPDGASIVTAEADGTISIGDLTGDAPADNAPAGDAAPAQAQGLTIAETIEISGHGAPLTAMALSPDGDKLATASLDGRLRITSIAWARLVHELPFAELPSGPERPKLEPQPLDESPYALMSGPPQIINGGPEEEQPFIVVYNARKSLGQALGAQGRAVEAGFPDSRIYRRRGIFRGVFAFDTLEARDEALPRIREVFSGAYARDLGSWCPNAVPQENFIDCADAMAEADAPAMAN